jgi:hypothetical protein
LRLSSAFAPGLLWLVAGCTLCGAVHDSMCLWASTRRGGKSLANIARAEIGPLAGTVGALAILFILIVALAGLGIAVVNALAESAWSTFTIGVTIPIGMLMGFHMFVFRKGHIREATIIGVVSAAWCRDLRTDVCRVVVRPLPGSHTASGHGRHGHLRTRGVDPADVDAADAPRLSEHRS